MSTSSISFQSNIGSTVISFGRSQSMEQLNPRQEKDVVELKKCDAHVKQHERAHLAAAGPYAKGGPRYNYVKGPDGKRYAVGGSVQLDTSKVPNDPEATIEKARTIKRAALAPADPSPKDRRIAAEADRVALEAQQELAKNKREERQGYNKDGRRVARTPEPATIDLVI